ncbi:glycerate kinase [Clostridium sp. MSJ-11]|uniref:Glycerate kinase n=1 Tax=Clostridium mobile TaxID=2841512 RepID=A0ABS6EKV0_9CLOT|nr:glycerate kinase [Clostridium mobile]MBU5485835.1 glycerate kinase [Clostridium mobile]
MKVVIAPDSFKESMTAKEAGESIKRGIEKVFKDSECIVVPMGDGGEGTLQSLVDATSGELVYLDVLGPLGKKTKAYYGISGDGERAFIEMAVASGLQLVPRDERNPLITTTYGTGELIKGALDKGVKNILVCIGGSATNDGGAGMIQALGARLLDSEGKEIGFGGGELHKIKNIDLSSLDKRIEDVSIEVACDVNNPLLGERGASRIFGPQKGADKETVEILEENMAHYAKVIEEELGIKVNGIPGGGAAGGLGMALMAFLKGKLSPGIDLVIQYTDLENKIKGAELVITGEGSMDSQTNYGKTPIGVSKVAKKYGIPVIAFAGRIGEGIEGLYENGISSVIGILREASTIEKALEDGKFNLEKAAENVARILKFNK